MKCCGDCVNRKDDVCLLFDELISMDMVCFMFTDDGDVE